MQVRDVMTKELVRVHPAATIGEAIRLMEAHRIRHLLVFDEGRLAGILSDRDLRLVRPSSYDAAERIEEALRSLTVAHAMTADVFTLPADASLVDAAALFVDHRIGALPVVEEALVVGIVSETDLLKALAAGYRPRSRAQ